MQLDLRKMFRPGAVPAQGEESFDFSTWDFSGYTVPLPVRLCWQAKPSGGLVYLTVSISAQAQAECARCLQPAAEDVCIDKNYTIGEEELREEFPELPVLPNGMLDLQELAYGELVIEGPAAVLCSEGCGGLCSQCGKPMGECSCEEQPEGDPRLAVLKSLLTENDDETGDSTD